MIELGYRMFDSDHHYYETDDCFTRHIESKYRDRTVWVDRTHPDGLGRLWLGDKRLEVMRAPLGDFVGRPGAARELMKQHADVDIALADGDVPAAFIDGELAASIGAINASVELPFVHDKRARLQLMDEQGVEAVFMIPSLGVVVEYQLRREPELLWPSLRSFNRWIEEDWGFGADGRIFGGAMLSLSRLEEAVVELERLIDAGCRAVIMSCGPVERRSPADPYFDPLWARIEEAGLNVIYHAGFDDLAEFYGGAWGEDPHPPYERIPPLRSVVASIDRGVSDTLAALVLHGLFDRFPRLKVLCIELGSTWVRPLVERLTKTLKASAPRTIPNGALELTPLEYFRRNIWVTPFWEEKNKADLVQLLGATHVLAGSDFPHPEGIANPTDFAADLLDCLDEAEVRRIMRDNMAELVGLLETAGP